MLMSSETFVIDFESCRTHKHLQISFESFVAPTEFDKF
jgi:hypothetical protein